MPVADSNDSRVSELIHDVGTLLRFAADTHGASRASAKGTWRQGVPPLKNDVLPEEKAYFLLRICALQRRRDCTSGTVSSIVRICLGPSGQRSFVEKENSNPADISQGERAGMVASATVGIAISSRATVADLNQHTAGKNGPLSECRTQGVMTLPGPLPKEKTQLPA